MVPSANPTYASSSLAVSSAEGVMMRIGASAVPPLAASFQYSPDWSSGTPPFHQRSTASDVAVWRRFRALVTMHGCRSGSACRWSMSTPMTRARRSHAAASTPAVVRPATPNPTSAPHSQDPGGDPMTASNTVGVDPHRKTLIATVLDSRGGELGHAHFPNTRPGLRDARRNADMT